MKIHSLAKTDGFVNWVERKHLHARSGTKIQVHRHERRKIREQLRRSEWGAGLEGANFA